MRFYKLEPRYEAFDISRARVGHSLFLIISSNAIWQVLDGRTHTIPISTRRDENL